MAQNDYLANLKEEWSTFLRHNPDARLVVEGMRARTGFQEDEVLFLLLTEWANQDLSPEQHREFADSARRSSTMNRVLN